MSHLILIVEDDTTIANWVRIFFEEAGYVAEVAHDGRDRPQPCSQSCPI